MKKILTPLFVLYFLVTALVWYFSIGGVQNGLIITILYDISAVSTVIAGFLVVKCYGIKSSHGKAFLFFALGFTAWLIGELIWTYYDLILHESPYPSPADIFYIAAYPLLSLGLILEIKLANIKFAKVDKFALALVAVLSLIFIAFVSYFGVIMTYDPTTTWLDNLAIVYGIGDLLLVIPALLILIIALEYKGGKISLPWFYIFLGVLCSLFADTLYGVYVNEYLNGEFPYSGLDLFWIAGYLLSALGLFKICFVIEDVRKKVELKAK